MLWLYYWQNSLRVCYSSKLIFDQFLSNNLLILYLFIHLLENVVSNRDIAKCPPTHSGKLLQLHNLCATLSHFSNTFLYSSCVIFWLFKKGVLNRVHQLSWRKSNWWWGIVKINISPLDSQSFTTARTNSILSSIFVTPLKISLGVTIFPTDPLTSLIFLIFLRCL